MLDNPNHSDVAEHALTDIEITVLKDIRSFLSVFHYAQQIVSAEKTPTLSIVIPVYEKLIGMFQNLKRHKPNIAHAIKASIEKLEEYMGKARSTKMYVLAMRTSHLCRLLYTLLILRSYQPSNQVALG